MKSKKLWHASLKGSNTFLCGKKKPKKFGKQDLKLDACRICFEKQHDELVKLQQNYNKLAGIYEAVLEPATKLHAAVQQQMDLLEAEAVLKKFKDADPLKAWKLGDPKNVQVICSIQKAGEPPVVTSSRAAIPAEALKKKRKAKQP